LPKQPEPWYDIENHASSHASATSLSPSRIIPNYQCGKFDGHDIKIPGNMGLVGGIDVSLAETIAGDSFPGQIEEEWEWKCTTNEDCQTATQMNGSAWFQLRMQLA
jgi:hypothetical protein